jgi:hypothetical protein
VQYIDQRSHPYLLLAHFAWAVLLNVKPFVAQGISHYVIQLQTDSSGNVQRKPEFVGGPVLQDSYGGGGTKAAKKGNQRQLSQPKTIFFRLIR